MSTNTDPTDAGEPLARDIMTSPAITVKPELGVKELAVPREYLYGKVLSHDVADS